MGFVPKQVHLFPLMGHQPKLHRLQHAHLHGQLAFGYSFYHRLSGGTSLVRTYQVDHLHDAHEFDAHQHIQQHQQHEKSWQHQNREQPYIRYLYQQVVHVGQAKVRPDVACWHPSRHG